jgi:uncharacterized membrane protein YphA (DoxX/SURF4 family)
LATVVMLVVLRLSLGCHFLYEGVWKYSHPKEFSAELGPFLLLAKGPAAPMFYAMLPDVDGRERLGQLDAEKHLSVGNGESWSNSWDQVRKKVVAKYRLSPEQKTQVDGITERYQGALKSYLKEHKGEILAYLNGLERFQAAESDRRAGVENDSTYYRKRLWDQQQDLRKEVNAWLADLDAMSDSYTKELWNVLDDDQKARGPITSGLNPLHWSRLEQLKFLVTFSLMAIGFCLIVGLCTRLSALGGAAFMIFILLTQPPWPTIYPPAPGPVGHALLVNKDFIEMVALFLLATTAAGRWGGLDYFIYHWFVRPINAYFSQQV